MNPKHTPQHEPKLDEEGLKLATGAVQRRVAAMSELEASTFAWEAEAFEWLARKAIVSYLSALPQEQGLSESERWEAFRMGFAQSCEGWNAEYPPIEDAGLRPSFDEWLLSSQQGEAE